MKDSSKNKAAEPPPAAAVDDALAKDALEALTRFGLGADAAAILRDHTPQHVLARVAAFGERAKRATNPPGFLRRSLQWALPENYQAREKRRTEAVRATQEAIESREQAEAAHAAWGAAVDARTAALEAEELADLLEQGEARAREVYGRATQTFVQIAMRELAAERFGMPPPGQGTKAQAGEARAES